MQNPTPSPKVSSPNPGTKAGAIAFCGIVGGGLLSQFGYSALGQALTLGSVILAFLTFAGMTLAASQKA